MFYNHYITTFLEDPPLSFTRKRTPRLYRKLEGTMLRMTDGVGSGRTVDTHYDSSPFSGS